MDLKDLEPFRKEIYELALKWKIKPKDVVDIYRHQFKLVREVIREDFKTKDTSERRSIKLRGLGTFEFRRFKAEIIDKKRKEKNEREILAKANSEDGNRDQFDQGND